MQIQALFSRGDGDSFHMRVDRFDYKFERNPHGNMVCEVFSDEHVKRLIDTGNFALYVEKNQDKTIKKPVNANKNTKGKKASKA